MSINRDFKVYFPVAYDSYHDPEVLPEEAYQWAHFAEVYILRHRYYRIPSIPSRCLYELTVRFQ